MSRTVTAALIIIGDEILSGRTRDANLGFLGRRLNELGIRLNEVRVVADDEDAIVAAVNACRTAFDYVFTTGGIGPTHDDITAASIAKAFGQKLIRNPDAVEILLASYARSGLEVNEARLSMANTPEHASLIENPVSGAPGFQVENVFVFAGVPKIMQAMFDGMTHLLTGGAPLDERSVAVDLGEGTIAETLVQVQDRFDGVTIGSYPYYHSGSFGVKLVLRGTDGTQLDAAASDLLTALQALGGNPYIEEAQA
jgi:molybdenum cofactor synthesis domain-containing protein